MRTPYDQLGKQMLRAGFETRCTVETDAEVPADPRRIDLWSTPTRLDVPLSHLGLLGELASDSGTFEFFHKTPNRDELAVCVIKHGEFRNFLARRKTPPPLPMQWIISSGRPDGGIIGFEFHPMLNWPSGFYEGPQLIWTRIIVVGELPVRRSTLLLRLLGAGTVFTQALSELEALSPDAPERALAQPILLQLRLAVPTDPAKQTRDDQEFLMETEDVVAKWWREADHSGFERGLTQGLERGLTQGLERGLEQQRKLLLRLLRRRFGPRVDGHAETRVASASGAQVEIWTERVLSASTLAELFAD